MTFGELLVNKPTNDAINFTSIAHHWVVWFYFVKVLFCLTCWLIENARCNSIIVKSASSYPAYVWMESSKLTAPFWNQTLCVLVLIDLNKFVYLILVHRAYKDLVKFILILPIGSDPTASVLPFSLTVLSLSSILNISSLSILKPIDIDDLRNLQNLRHRSSLS